MFGHRSDLDLRVHAYIIDPKTIHTTQQAAQWGGYAARDIAAAKELIRKLEEYQQMLYQRVQEIEAAPWHTELYLIRDRSYRTGKVEYTIKLLKVYDTAGIGPSVIETRKYAGSERHKALADYETTRKSRPGIIAHKEIEKGWWEK